MKTTCFLIVLIVSLIFISGCKTHSGSREFVPGKGWIHND